MHHPQEPGHAAQSQTSTHTTCGFPDGVTVETLEETHFLTVDSDPQAEEAWGRFHCNNTVRVTRPDFFKSLSQMFAQKPTGQYLVRVQVSLALTTLDFEPKAVPVDPDMETAADASSYASLETQAACLGMVTQEAAETTAQSWLPEDEVGESLVGATVQDGETFDPDKHF